MRFENLNLDPRLLQAIAKRGYTETTDVQERTLGLTLRGRDAAVQSQTGTGKTAAFLITIFERLLRDPSRKSGRALIIVPTRELATQIEGEARLLNRTLGFSIGSFYGGVGYENQLSLLRKGVDILVGTPGRLMDLDERGNPETRRHPHPRRRRGGPPLRHGIPARHQENHPQMPHGRQTPEHALQRHAEPDCPADRHGSHEPGRNSSN